MSELLKLAEDYGKIIDQLREDNARLRGLLREGWELSYCPGESFMTKHLLEKVPQWRERVRKELAE